MLTLASLVKTAKQYALDTSMTDEAFLNALLEPYVQAGRIKGRNGMEFHLDAPRTSRLLNGKADVPKALKKPLRRFGIEDDVAKRAGLFLDDCVDSECEAQFEEELLAELDVSNASDAALLVRLEGLKGDLDRFFACAFLASLKRPNLTAREQTLWQNGTGSFAVEIGDLFDMGFGRRKKRKNIVVIPVDTSFDTVVSWGYEEAECPRVSATSVHGMWLERMYRCGETPETLAGRIGRSLEAREQMPASTGERHRYPIGAVAVVENQKALFYLLATSEFDERNVAHSSPESIKKALASLIGEYDTMGQGLDLYLPLMGTGLSRAGLSNKESYELVVRTIAELRRNVHGRVTLIICPEAASELGAPIAKDGRLDGV